MTRAPPRKPNPRTPKGFCVWCGSRVEGRRRTWCSDACVDEYRIANFAGDAQKAVFRRDHGVCAGCGVDTKLTGKWRRKRFPRGFGFGWYPEGPVTEVEYVPAEWEADHVVPLWSVDRDAPDAFRYWSLSNIQTLCVRCHKAKTKREAAARAARARPANVQTDLFPDAAVMT